LLKFDKIKLKNNIVKFYSLGNVIKTKPFQINYMIFFIHFFNTFKAYSLVSPLNGNKLGLIFYILPCLSVTGTDLFNSYRLPYLILFFFWYFKICCAANSKIFASGNPFLQIALKKY
jgi:hypothetical protein